MQPPLAILARHADAVLLQAGGFAALPVPGFGMRPRAFSSSSDASSYFGYWLHDGGAMTRLRQVLHTVGHSRSVAQCTDQEVVDALAAKVLEGALVVRVREGTEAFLNVRAAFGAAAAKSAAASAVSPQEVIRPEPAPPVTPPAPPPAPILPILELVQIEGAEVLPEILQTLEQIDLSLGSLDLASASLEPTPSGIAAISSSMAAAADDVSSTLGEL